MPLERKVGRSVLNVASTLVGCCQTSVDKFKPAQSIACLVDGADVEKSIGVKAVFVVALMSVHYWVLLGGAMRRILNLAVLCIYLRSLSESNSENFPRALLRLKLFKAWLPVIASLAS